MSKFEKDLMKALHEGIEEALKEAEVEIECPSCDNELEFTLSQIGKTIKCPHCGQRIKLKRK